MVGRFYAKAANKMLDNHLECLLYYKQADEDDLELRKNLKSDLQKAFNINVDAYAPGPFKTTTRNISSMKDAWDVFHEKQPVGAIKNAAEKKFPIIGTAMRDKRVENNIE